VSKKIITVRTDGTMQFVYDDGLRGLLKHGLASVTRASHVEPWGGLSEDAVTWLKELRDVAFKPGESPAGDWWADLLPSGGDVLGPFGSRHAALAAEVDWLNKNVLTKF
jgi:hypothetical protein